VSAVWIYLATGIYNFSMYYMFNGFYVFDFSALRALLSSHIMTNKDDDNDDDIYATNLWSQCLML